MLRCELVSSFAGLERCEHPQAKGSGEHRCQQGNQLGDFGTTIRTNQRQD